MYTKAIFHSFPENVFWYETKSNSSCQDVRLYVLNQHAKHYSLSMFIYPHGFVCAVLSEYLCMWFYVHLFLIVIMNV